MPQPTIIDVTHYKQKWLAIYNKNGNQMIRRKRFDERRFNTLCRTIGSLNDHFDEFHKLRGLNTITYDLLILFACMIKDNKALALKSFHYYHL